MARRANYTWFRKERGKRGFITILDLGPWDLYFTVTNDAENVIADLAKEGVLGDRVVLYQDTEGRWDELLHENGEFTGFRSVGSHTEEAAIEKWVRDYGKGS